MLNLASSAVPSRSRTVAYWATTTIVAGEFLVGGVMDVMRVPPFFGVMLHLGYPPYFSIIGTWKVLGAAAVLVPRSARLKEWAYAGMVFDLTGAAASHLAVGNGAGAVVAPLVFTGLVMVSWALRPPARRDLCPRDT
jgi:DoxX-like family